MNSVICLGCERNVHKNDLICCISCKGGFHYECLNITKGHFESHSTEIRRTWRCMECQRITRRIRNDNTPVRRNTDHLSVNDTGMSLEDHFAEDRSIFGDTITTDTSIQNTQGKSRLQEQNCTLEQISQLLDTKFEINKKSIISEIKTIIQSEITSSINKLKLELTQKTTMLTTEQANMKKDLRDLNEKIKTMELECQKLKNEMNTIFEQSAHATIPEKCTDNSKKIVLYGLNEYHRETENELNDRIINLFDDILNINLYGYIEEINRIGKRGPRRPIVIELMSKRTT